MKLTQVTIILIGIFLSLSFGYGQNEERQTKIPVFTNASLQPYLENLQDNQIGQPIAETLEATINKAQESAPVATKKDNIIALIHNAGFSTNSVSILLTSVKDGKTHYALNADIPRNPASVTKVITTGVALAQLGADYRWRTEFFAVGKLRGQVLDGHLAVKGYGNPYFVEEKLDEAVAKIRSLGLRKITGDLLLDGNFYQVGIERPNQFDGKGTEPYNAVPSALSINFRTAELIFHASKQGVELSTRPKLTYTQLINDIKLNHLPCHRGFKPKLIVTPNSDAVRVTGTVSSQCGTKRLSKVFTDAGDLLAGHFARAWHVAGGEFNGFWYYDVVQPSYQLLHTAYSRPLSKQIKAMNRFSNNLMTRQLFLTLGAVAFGPPANKTKGRDAVMQFLRQSDIDTNAMFIDNGSGLSRQTRLSARQLGQFLIKMANSDDADVFFASLSVAGRNGTLKKRLKQTSLADNFHGKTGTLNNVKALAGYFTSESGQLMSFVMLINANGAKYATSLIDKVLHHLYLAYP